MPRSQIRTTYQKAAVERLNGSRVLIESQDYAASIYLSGLAAESMIKAFIVRKDDVIKGHNLSILARNANFARRLSGDVRDEVNAAIEEATLLWRNLFRYCSAEDLNYIGRQWRICFRVDGKKNYYGSSKEFETKLWAERLYNLASLIVQEGSLIWHRKKH